MARRVVTPRSENERFVVLGNPENRRVTLFASALEARGFEPPVVVSWRRFLEEPRVVEQLELERCWFRIDSSGEDFEVERALLRLGAPAAARRNISRLSLRAIDRLTDDRGRINPPRQLHLGFEKALGRLKKLFARRPGWRVLNPIDDVLELFDKRRTSQRYAAAGIPVADSLGPVRDFASLGRKMDAGSVPAVFVKLSSGSSASCLGVYHRARGREAFHTTIEQADTGWYNTLRLQHVLDKRRIAELIGFLLREGAQVERAIPKARLGGSYFDLRVLCVAGEPAFIVVRQNQHPITNLHLGGWRGDLAALQAEVPRADWDAAMDSCRKVAALYRCLHLGIDLMFDPDWGHRIIEANAFGDLLPNLTREGMNVWEWELHALPRWKLLHSLPRRD